MSYWGHNREKAADYIVSTPASNWSAIPVDSSELSGKIYRLQILESIRLFSCFRTELPNERLSFYS